MQQPMEQGAQVEFPVDNGTYNLLVTLTEKLQALESYQTYSKDVSGRELDLFRQLIDEDTRHAQQILEVLRDRLSNR